MLEDPVAVLLQRRGVTGVTTLSLRDHVVEMELGILPDEQDRAQRIRFDVDLHFTGAGAPAEDQIDQVLDYDFIRATIDAAAAGGRTNLLESIVADLLDTYMRPHEVEAACVAATKLDVYDGDAEVGCRMIRIRD
jgi:dihydroneopterin aldolase